MVSFLMQFFLCAPALAESDWTVESLMQTLAAVEKAELTFSEQRSSVFLIGGIKLKGRIIYQAPDFVKKLIEHPYIESIEIKGDKIIIEKESKRGEPIIQRFSLASSEALNITVSGIRGTLSGDLSQLLEYYDVQFDGGREAWSVTLTPIKEAIRKRIDHIAISGSDNKIHMIDTYNSDGDETTLTLSYQTIN